MFHQHKEMITKFVFHESLSHWDCLRLYDSMRDDEMTQRESESKKKNFEPYLFEFSLDVLLGQPSRRILLDDDFTV